MQGTVGVGLVSVNSFLIKTFPPNRKAAYQIVRELVA